MNSLYPRWTDPVRVHLQSGLTRTFSCIYDALDFLENEWPTRDGVLYERAIRQCREALGRSLPAPVAREAFAFACLEAGMPVAGDRQRQAALRAPFSPADGRIAATTRMAHALAGA
ncbi:DUF982 domain-containing protein [Rhizobium sp. TRM96647]|uniref:DUF982 domain-containing protein n=1 Tax=unclassified Rhizobium TaxID=2613769 RepID=UPI0021E85719|nr:MULTISPECIES: DUF982 domain-containing protein [unclassified Rhizobium]MCV3738219.1 DUF982 domain-containing protein [Rhizobium sp. TRM96647]MCV3760032.1 DUF982 domain-containing protein [Rhizobium sp. TRM96650]